MRPVNHPLTMRRANLLGERESRVVVPSTTQSRCPFRLRGRSFMAFVLVPEPPLGDWIADLDNQVQRSEGFFVGRPVVLDVSRMTLTRSDLSDLIADLRTREIRVMA